MDLSDFNLHPGSYKDSDAYVIVKDGVCYRILTDNYIPHYDKLISTGLYKELTQKGFLVSHEEKTSDNSNNHKILLPNQIPFISYPYEWSFDQLKDAALLTLEIQLMALKAGMSLKDASAYNVQFVNSTPIFIDTGSFEILDDTKPWNAYGQFCRHFLAPLALMKYTDVRLGNLLSVNLDGIPLDLCVKLLPFKTRFNLGIFTHLYLHSRAVKKFEDYHKEIKSEATFNLKRIFNVIQHLKVTVESLNNIRQKTTWDDYYDSNNNYSKTSFTLKNEWIEQKIESKRNELLLVWDMGANNGTFSRLSAGKGITTIAMDIDSNAVNAHYMQIKSQDNPVSILPLIIDLANPTSANGWNTQERMSIFQRPKPDLIMALALIHHLAIGLNVPLAKIASFFAEHTRNYFC